MEILKTLSTSAIRFSSKEIGSFEENISTVAFFPLQKGKTVERKSETGPSISLFEDKADSLKKTATPFCFSVAVLCD